MTGFLRSDVKRLMKGCHLYIAAVGVAAALLFSLERRGIRNSVLESYIAAVIGSGVHVADVFCAFAFATVFCEDLERKYLRYEIIRGNVKSYVFSKVLVIYLSAIAAMLMGTLLYVGFCRIFVPWGNGMDSVYRLTAAGSYGALVEGRHYLLYCMLYSLQLGLFTGALAVIAAYFSLFISNTVLVLVLPLLLDQILLELPTNSVFSFLCFQPNTQPFLQDWKNFVLSMTLSLIPTLLFGAGICKRVKERL